MIETSMPMMMRVCASRARAHMCVCVCVCVCARAQDAARGGKEERVMDLCRCQVAPPCDPSRGSERSLRSVDII